VDYRKKTGSFAWKERGKLKEGTTSGPGGFVAYGPLAEGPGRYSCPKSAPAWKGGTWDPKRIIGETPVHEDGSASFFVSAKAPVHFQLVDC
jgi:hypothetical protein